MKLYWELIKITTSLRLIRRSRKRAWHRLKAAVHSFQTVPSSSPKSSYASVWWRILAVTPILFFRIDPISEVIDVEKSNPAMLSFFRWNGIHSSKIYWNWRKHVCWQVRFVLDESVVARSLWCYIFSNRLISCLVIGSSDFNRPQRLICVCIYHISFLTLFPKHRWTERLHMF